MTENSGIDFIRTKSKAINGREGLFMKLGVIGAGNMASAIVKGVAGSGKIDAHSIYVSDKDTAKLDALANQTGVNVSGNNSEVYKNSDVIIFAVKPNVYPIVLDEASKSGGIGEKLIISIAPGISTKTIEGYFDMGAHVVRTMPNTPAMVGEGMSVLCRGTNVSDEQFDTANMIFSCIGKTAELGENMMDAVVAISGSSPAYVFMLIEAMADAGVQSGLARSVSYELAAQSVLGSAKMVLDTKKHPGELKDMVCSPGGTTIDAVAALEKKGFRSAIIEAMDVCTKKTRAMG